MLDPARARLDGVAEVRQRGLMVGIELAQDGRATASDTG